MNRVSGISNKARSRLALLLRKTQGTIATSEAAKILNLSAAEAAKTMARLAEKGWISRVKRGLYVPVPVESSTTEPALQDPWLIAQRLFAPCYIGGWSAAEYWQLTEQFFQRIVAITTRKQRNREVAMRGVSFLIKTISPDALFGTLPVWRGSLRIDVSDSSRTIIDILDDPRLGGGIQHVSDILAEYLKSDQKNTKLLIDYGDRLGNRTVFKRLGFLMSRLAPEDKEFLDACRKRLSKGYSPLDPALPKEKIVRAWRLWVPAYWTGKKIA
jgi:predicted transcriptional regulator of viral defense system